MPTRNSQTDEYIITTDFLEVSATNGAPITSYHVQIDDGNGGEYVTIKGDPVEDLALSATKSTGIVPGT